MIEEPKKPARAAQRHPPTWRTLSYLDFCVLTDALEASLVPQTCNQISAATGLTRYTTARRLKALITSGDAYRAEEKTGRQHGPVQFVYWRRKP